MSTTLLTFRLLLNGVPADPTGNSVLLSDPTGAYGVQRTDTNGVVVADGTAMTRASTGVYTYSVTDPALGLVYRWYAEYVAGGVTIHDPFMTDGTPAVEATGFWWTQAALQSRWGVINTAVESALDGQGSADVATIQAVGNGVDADADRLVRAYGYGRPVPADSDDYAVASRIAVDALHYRLEGRRGPDLTPTARDKLAAAEAAAWAALEDLLQGPTAYNGAAIDFPRTGTAPVTAPIGLRPTTDLDGRTVLSPVFGRGPVWDAAAGYWRYW